VCTKDNCGQEYPAQNKIEPTVLSAAEKLINYRDSVSFNDFDLTDADVMFDELRVAISRTKGAPLSALPQN
jgi:hypothetical protein